MEPKTQRQIETAQKNKKAAVEYVTIQNTSRQMVGIQLKSPDGIDWYHGEQTVQLHVGKRHDFDKSRLYWDSQIENLRKRGAIKVFMK